MFTTHKYCLAQSTPPHFNDLSRELVLWWSARFFILNPFIRIFLFIHKKDSMGKILILSFFYYPVGLKSFSIINLIAL